MTDGDDAVSVLRWNLKKIRESASGTGKRQRGRDPETLRRVGECYDALEEIEAALDAGDDDANGDDADE